MPEKLNAWKDSSGRLFESFDAANCSELKGTLRADMHRAYVCRPHANAEDLIDQIAKDPHPAMAALGKFIMGLGEKDTAP